MRLLTGLIAAILMMPVAALAVIAFTGDIESFRHITQNVLPHASLTTGYLLVGVGLFVAICGTTTAWLVSYYDFPGRGALEWALMLPLAVPTYISAYAFVEFFSFTGPLQSIVRSVGGFDSPRDYWFPEIRSLSGTIFVMGLVLYPYVYLSVRTLFHFQGNTIVDSARTLGASRWRLLLRIIVPTARPAIILGIALALMETINDIGAVEYLGTRTLTFSIFSVWLNQNDLAGAAQIALFLLAIVIGLLLLERASRRGRRFHDLLAGRKSGVVVRAELSGFSAIAASIACLIPVLAGFGIPVSVLGGYALSHFRLSEAAPLVEALMTSVLLAGIAAVLAVLIGLFLAYAVRVCARKSVDALVKAASSGYAVPGTLLALGIFLPLAMFDNFVDGISRSMFGFSTGLMITGSGAAIIYAYLVRFMAMAEGTLDSGFKKVSPNIDMAARSLGSTIRGTLRFVLLPIMRPAMAAAALLVFVESIKELSATIMLRPFGVNTLATYVYDFASRAQVEEAAVGCLLIVAAGIIPVAILQKASAPKF